MNNYPKYHSFTSPLRYPGGKGMLSNFIKLLIARNTLFDGHYIEVYAGGAAIAWSLLFEEYVSHVHVNDIDKSIIAFWKCVLKYPDDLCKMIRDTPVTIEEWYRQKTIHSKSSNHSQIQHAFSTFFLNRTNRSGIIKGGVIGGKNQAGQWKLDARFNKHDLIARINRIARYAHRISIYNLDASDFMKTVVPRIPPKSILYLDPPYYTKGQDLYEHHYQHHDHVNISQLITRKINRPWVVSYDATPTIKRLYNNFRSIHYELSYSVHNRYSGSEIMFFSHGLTLPQVGHPAKITTSELVRTTLMNTN